MCVCVGGGGRVAHDLIINCTTLDIIEYEFINSCTTRDIRSSKHYSHSHSHAQLDSNVVDFTRCGASAEGLNAILNAYVMLLLEMMTSLHIDFQ